MVEASFGMSEISRVGTHASASGVSGVSCTFHGLGIRKLARLDHHWTAHEYASRHMDMHMDIHIHMDIMRSRQSCFLT